MKYQKKCICLGACLIISSLVLSSCIAETDSSGASDVLSSAVSEAESEVSSESSAEETPDEESDDESSTAEEESEDESVSIPELDDPTPEAEGAFYNGIYVYNNTAFEMFYGGSSAAENYAQTMSSIKASLGDNITVYNIVVPTHCEIGLPERFSSLCSSQRDYLDVLFSSYTEDIIYIDPYYTLMQNRNEYLYFNTDHHWTVDAAYLVYQLFAETAGITPISEDIMTRQSIEGFVGSLASLTDAGLEDYPDTVYYYTFDCDITTTQYDEYGENPVESIMLHEYASGSNAYGVFLGGDMPLIVTENEDGNGEKIAIVKESYGNAFAPFIAATYSETHIIDSRYFEGNLNEYLEENGIDTVIFINNTMASATSTRCDELLALVE